MAACTSSTETIALSSSTCKCDVDCTPYHLCLFVCLRSATAFFPRGQLPREDLRRSPLPPRPLVIPGPCLTFCSLSPRSFVMHPASGPYPPMSSCPVRITYNHFLWQYHTHWAAPVNITVSNINRNPVSVHVSFLPLTADDYKSGSKVNATQWYLVLLFKTKRFSPNITTISAFPWWLS